MSFYVTDWVLSEAPTANINEFAILTAMAARADREGCGVWLSVPKLAKACHCDPKTVRTHIQNMVERGLLGPGDPTSPGAQRWKELRADNQPNLYDILVPLDWYSAKQLSDINEERALAGREPLTSENRPPIAPAPPEAKRKPRSDKGKARPERRKNKPADKEPALPAETATGGISVPPFEAPEKYSQERERGEYDSGRGGNEIPVAGGLIFPRICKKNPSEETVSGGGNPPPPPHPPADLTAGHVDHGVALRGDHVGDQQTACAELGVVAANSDDDGSGSAQDRVMAEVRSRYPSKIRSRAQRRSQRPVERSEASPATTSLAG